MFNQMRLHVCESAPVLMDDLAKDWVASISSRLALHANPPALALSDAVFFHGALDLPSSRQGV